MPVATLVNRAFLTVSGPEAGDFLQGIITTDVGDIGEGEAHPGALLTPQGKILYEFLISHTADGFLIETDAGSVDPLLRRLMLYRLRAKVTIQKTPQAVTRIVWERTETGGLRDMRFARAGVELFRSPADEDGAPATAYRALRVVHGIGGGAEDGEATDFFPHDLLMDRNGGLDFRKGCYVGQEVVSRMQHRSTARRRLVIVGAVEPLPPAGAPIKAGDREIGTLRAVEGSSGLAVVRIDKAGEAMANHVPITADEVAVTLALPVWSGLEFPATADEAVP